MAAHSTQTIPDVMLHHRLRIALEHAHVEPEEMAEELGTHVNTVYNYPLAWFATGFGFGGVLGSSFTWLWCRFTAARAAWKAAGCPGDHPYLTAPLPKAEIVPLVAGITAGMVTQAAAMKAAGLMPERKVWA